ncbi:MAG: GntR family transcriptional regulator [Rhodospirillales bacterium]|nr:MAG: GntR family transcriptional regulator [Rhodospirillales bacterium]
MVGTKPVARGGLTESAALRLREMIVDGTLPPGQSLNERLLCAELGVSRTPLREALRWLAGEGLVTMPANRGAVVADPTAEELRCAFDVLGALEGLSGELACVHATPLDLEALRALGGTMQTAFERDDPPAYDQAYRDLHDRLDTAAGNPELTRIRRALEDRLAAARYRTTRDRAKWQRAVEDHAGLVEKLAARDAAAARRLLVAHVGRERDAAVSRAATKKRAAAWRRKRKDAA